MKDADLDARETLQEAGLKLLAGHFVQVRSTRSRVESGMQRRNMDASTLLILKRAGRGRRERKFVRSTIIRNCSAFYPSGKRRSAAVRTTV